MQISFALFTWYVLLVVFFVDVTTLNVMYILKV